MFVLSSEDKSKCSVSYELSLSVLVLTNRLHCIKRGREGGRGERERERRECCSERDDSLMKVRTRGLYLQRLE